MHCLWCHKEIIPEVTWENVFNFFERDKVICQACERKLTMIQGPQCPKCSRPSEQAITCDDCRYWEEHNELKDVLTKNISIFSYSTMMKDIMTRWKYRGDYILVEIFRDAVTKHFKKNFKKKSVHLVPIPLSEKRLEERGFNQAEAIAKLLNVPIINALGRNSSEKQAKKSRSERLQANNPFQVKITVKGHVILIDDLYTTGATLHQAAYLLKEAGADTVESFTLIRS